MPKPFIHPIHARGVQARRYNAVVLGPLTDATINKYELAGYYGEDRRLAAEARRREAHEKRHVLGANKAKKESIVAKTFAELDKLL